MDQAKDPTPPGNKPGLPDWLGLRPLAGWDFGRARPLGAFVGFLLALLALTLAIIFFATLFDFAKVATGLGNPPDNFDMRAAGVLLAFLLGAPFVIWRTQVASRQAEIAAESLFNDKINAASEGLSARRQVTRVTGQGAEERVLSEWQDDLVARNAAIDRLEGLVHERPEAADRVASLLSVYVVELSAEHLPETPPKDAAPGDLGFWAGGLTRKRSDMERAAQALGRLQRIPGVTLQEGRINLRRANLQGFDLRVLDFTKARLEDAHLEGANLWDAHLEGADLRGAHLEGADLGGAHLDEKTSLTDATLRGASVREVDWSMVNISQDQVNSIFGDASVTLPPGITRPAHWPDTELDPLSFEAEYNKWRADPATYTPPKNRS